MKVGDYEKLIRKKGMKPVKKLQRSDYNIYISEGIHSKGDQDDPGPHYKTMYAFGTGEKLFLAEFYTTPLLQGSKREDRIKEAEERALDQLAAFKETGCLKS